MLTRWSPFQELDIFERRIGADPVEISPSLHAMEIDAATESQRYVAGVKALWFGIEDLTAVYVDLWKQIDTNDTVLLLPAATRYETPGGVTETSTERRVTSMVGQPWRSNSRRAAITSSRTASRSM